MALSMDTSLPLSAVVQARSSLSADAAPRHLDPRVSLAVLVMINVQMALSQSLFAEMGVLALTVAVMAYCRRFKGRIVYRRTVVSFIRNCPNDDARNFVKVSRMRDRSPLHLRAFCVKKTDQLLFLLT